MSGGTENPADGDIPSGLIEQLIDVSWYTDTIDRSNVEMNLSWELKVPYGDIGRVEMIQLDVNLKELGTSYDSGWQNDWSADWKRFDSSISPMKGIRYIRARLSSTLFPRPGNQQSSLDGPAR